MSRYLYVTSKAANARYAHMGHPITACGQVFVGPHRKSENMPADRALCRACVRAATGYGWITADEADAMLGRSPRPRKGRQGADQLVPLLAAGRSDRDVALHLGVSMRTVQRLVTDAMHGIGARTRFQWGYRAGLAAR
jgi:DNA-binding NarL/FixJ family response regulator